jgi:hypothetical protein
MTCSADDILQEFARRTSIIEVPPEVSVGAAGRAFDGPISCPKPLSFCVAGSSDGVLGRLRQKVSLNKRRCAPQTPRPVAPALPKALFSTNFCCNQIRRR